MLVSGVQHSDSAFLQIILHYRLLDNVLYLKSLLLIYLKFLKIFMYLATSGLSCRSLLCHVGSLAAGHELTGLAAPWHVGPSFPN